MPGAGIVGAVHADTGQSVALQPQRARGLQSLQALPLVGVQPGPTPASAGCSTLVSSYQGPQSPMPLMVEEGTGQLFSEYPIIVFFDIFHNETLVVHFGGTPQGDGMSTPGMLTWGHPWLSGSTPSLAWCCIAGL